MNFTLNTEKLTEKSFLRMMITSIAGILLCMTFLCTTTWAWYVESIDSNDAQIVSAQSDVMIESVIGPGGTMIEVEIAALLSDNGAILAAGTYTVSLSRSVGSSSGYFVIETEDGAIYYADGLIRNSENDTDVWASYRFELPMDARVRLEIRWGIYSGEAEIKRMILDNNTEEVAPFVIPITVEAAPDSNTEKEPVADPNESDEAGDPVPDNTENDEQVEPTPDANESGESDLPVTE